MFLLILFLLLASLGGYFFPELSAVTVLLMSFACVAALRLYLFFAERKNKAPKKNTAP